MSGDYQGWSDFRDHGGGLGGDERRGGANRGGEWGVMIMVEGNERW